MLRRIAFQITFLVLLDATLVVADEPIKDVNNAKPGVNVFENATRNQPLVLQSEADAGKYFADEALARLIQQVDFEKQIVLVFAWRGSGQDRLTYDVAESYPEQIAFNYKPGRTRDLRPHTFVFALRSNVTWRTPDGKPGTAKDAAADEHINVEVLGKLDAQVMAIGGETTGVTITARGMTWELDFGDDRELRREAEKLHNQSVAVKGNLVVKQGVEIGQRWIVNVTSLIDAKAMKDANEHP
jgi:hypothetical protein